MIIGIEAFILHILPLALLNIFSVAWFIYNSYRMKKSSIEKYATAEILMMFEIIIHQIIAFFIVGSQCGFQYILLSCSTQIFTLYKNKKSKIMYSIKASLMLCMFILFQWGGLYYKPIYKVKPEIASLWSITIIIYSFTITIIFTLLGYINMMNSMNTFKQESENKSKKISDMQIQVIMCLANVIENRDGSTGEHIKRTEQYVRKIISALEMMPEYDDKLSETYKINLENAAPLHDIGKIKIPDNILKKQGKLTTDEYGEIKKHTVYGSDIIKQTIVELEDPEYTQIAYNVALYHHEKWDGTGYPLGLSKTEIPLEARIMALADVYDALLTKRCYKDAYTKEKVLGIIEAGKGTHFDPQLADIFIDIIRNDSSNVE